MKKIFIAIALFSGLITIAQTLSYNDIGVLFANEGNTGTARFNAMSGAFGSLGGDLSAISINPAGAAVFLKSEISFSIDFNNTDTRANYYGNNNYASNDNVNFAQTGGVFVYKKNYRNVNNAGWGRFAFAFDYTKINDFNNLWLAQGNRKEYPTYIYDPNDEDILYQYSNGQYFENSTSGSNDKYNFTFAAEYNNKLYIGASFTTYNIDFNQVVLLEEYNKEYNDNEPNNNFLDASLFQELYTYGNGYSFNFGVIGKPTKNVRLGFAYQSPVWYNLGEDYLDYDEQIYVSNVNEYYTENSGVSRYYYDLRVPSKYTGSFAYIFDKYGLFSIDYVYRNHSNITLTNGAFNEENQNFSKFLRSTNEVRLGTEWRIEQFSLRGGYHFEQSPYKNAISTDNKEGYSFGLGYNFGAVKIDLSYQQDSQTGTYDYYPQYDEIDPVNLDLSYSKFTATMVIGI